MSAVAEVEKESTELDELVVDHFAGGGGASEGIEQALGRPVDLAIDHDATAIAVHERSVTQLAAAWQQFAQHGGDTTDPNVQLLGVAAESGGYNLAFVVPCTATLVVIHTAAPYPTEESAWYSMWGLLQQLNCRGAINLGDNL